MKYEIPYPFNVGISTGRIQNYLFGDTNDSANWREFKIQLPEGEWEITERGVREVTVERKK